VSVPGLDISVEPPGAAENALAARILQIRATSQDEATAAEERSIAATELAEYKEAFKAATSRAHDELKRRARKAAVPDHISSASDEIDAAIDEVVSSRANAALVDAEAIDLALGELRDSMKNLAQNLKRSEILEGDSLSWLMRAAAIQDE
jgi:hypothetical protein